MTRTEIARLRTLEGSQVSLVLRNGSRTADGMLMSAGRGRTTTVWVVIAETDVFVPLARIAAFSPNRVLRSA